jgi:hypothetical protein
LPPAAFCPNCGKPAPEGLSFCPSCGFNLKAFATPPPKTQAPSIVAEAPQVTPKKKNTARNAGVGLIFVTLLIGVLLFLAFGLSPVNNIPAGYTSNGDGTYCPPGYPYYASLTGTCYQGQNSDGTGSGGNVFVYTPVNNGATGWVVQATGADSYQCSNGNQNCNCGHVYVHTYHGVTDYSYESSPNNGMSRSEPGYQYPDMTKYQTLTNGYPTPDGAYAIAVIDYSGGQTAVYCVSVFSSSAPPV